MRPYENYSARELRRIFVACSDDSGVFAAVIAEIALRPLEDAHFILKGAKPSFRSAPQPKPNLPSGAKHAPPSTPLASTPPVEQPLIYLGQEIEFGIYVVSIDYDKGTFEARESDDIIYEYNICDFVPNWRSPDKGSPATTHKDVAPGALDTPTVMPEPISPPERQPTSPPPSATTTGVIQAPPTVMHGTIRPVGEAKGTPSAWSRTTETSLVLDFNRNDSITVRYRRMLEALISELRGANSGASNITLEHGRRVEIQGRGGVYKFPFDGEAALFEGANVFATLNGVRAEGQIAAVLPGDILIAFKDDYGDDIEKCFLRIDNTAMLQSLCEKLEMIEKNEFADFNLTMASNVITNTGEDHHGNLPKSCTGLNEKQREAVGKALANEVFYLWGPPGTGKTQTMSALIDELLSSDKRILLCSNTNQAVDQVLLKLCKESLEDEKSSAALLIKEEKVIRIGRIAQQELESDWGESVSLNCIVDRKSLALRERLNTIERIIASIEREISESRRVVQQFKAHQKSENAYRRAANKLQQEKDMLLKFDRALESQTAIINRLKKKLDEANRAGPLKRLIIQAPEAISADLALTQTSIDKIIIDADSQRIVVTESQSKVDDLAREIDKLKAAIEGKDLTSAEKAVADGEAKKQPLTEEAADLNRKLNDISKAVVEDAKLVGATVTKTYISPQLFKKFDVVVVDEASMVILPALYFVAGLAKEKVVISGDHRQLSAIVQSKQQVILDGIGQDIFTINKFSKPRSRHKRFLMLEVQYRMVNEICKLISGRMYGGLLKTSSSRNGPRAHPPVPFDERLIIIDTSALMPFVNTDRSKSRFNLINALTIRNLCLHLKESGFISSPSQVGVCTPYAAQSTLLKRILTASGINEEEVQAGTVHRYQGDQRNLIILDIPDSEGDSYVGQFLQALGPEDNGARLFNVAVSRVEDTLIVVANLDYLDRKLPNMAFLRGILADMVTRGHVIDAREVIALRPIWDELRRAGVPINLSTANLSDSIFSQHEFHSLCIRDMESAKKGILVYSGFITPQRTAVYDAVFRCKIAEGIPVRCVTRPPSGNGSIPAEDTKRALDALQAIGCAVDTRSLTHEKAVIIDEKIVWFGSLNPLSHTGNTSEMMARIEDPGFARQIMEFLALDKNANHYKAENPRCPDCQARTCLTKGRFGLFWRCENCDWHAGYQPGRSAATPQVDPPPGESRTCPDCGSQMRWKSGRHGPFWSCSAYPACRTTIRGRECEL